ncbi:DNA-binding protein [Pseudomonas massiliensis]|uniref:DNA-binding protein n=1 Tax=Pseudomonas massiliensis TaxID=522492 RepID=UPI00058CF14A|nr:DNA-binding protein [Pseudomonas massiliensis]
MARGGIDKASVDKARKALLAKGQNPSIDAIRIELGNTGSKSTIHRYLKELDQAEGTLAEGMGSISDTLSELVGALAQRLHDEAQARIDTAQEAFDTHRARLQGTLNDQAERLVQLERTLADRDLALAGAGEQIARLQETIQAARLDNARLSQAREDLQSRLADQQSQASAWEGKHQQAVEALRQERLDSQALCEQERRHHEAIAMGLQEELRQAQAGLKAVQETLTQRDSDSRHLRTALEQGEAREQEAQARIAALQGELAQLAALRGQAEGSRDALSQQLAQEREQAREAAAKQLAHTGELAEARARIGWLEQALAQAHAEAQAQRARKGSKP